MQQLLAPWVGGLVGYLGARGLYLTPQQTLALTAILAGFASNLVHVLKANMAPWGLDTPPAPTLQARTMAGGEGRSATAIADGARSPSAAARVAKLLLLSVCTGAMVAGTAACVTTQAQRSTLAVITDAAVIAVVQQGTSDPAVEHARAVKIAAIAAQLQAINNATVQSLPQVVQAVGPLIAAAGLNPAEVILAQQLVAALSAQLQAQLGANPKAAEVQTTVGVLLADVLAACAAYGA